MLDLGEPDHEMQHGEGTLAVWQRAEVIITRLNGHFDIELAQRFMDLSDQHLAKHPDEAAHGRADPRQVVEHRHDRCLQQDDRRRTTGTRLTGWRTPLESSTGSTSAGSVSARSTRAGLPRTSPPGILKHWTDLWGSERVTVSYGQGFAASLDPDRVTAVNAIANDGTYVAPRLGARQRSTRQRGDHRRPTPSESPAR